MKIFSKKGLFGKMQLQDLATSLEIDLQTAIKLRGAVGFLNGETLDNDDQPNPPNLQQFVDDFRKGQKENK